MSKFHMARELLEKAKNEAEIVKAATFIQTNSKALGLDYVDLEKLSDMGFHYYEKMQRDGLALAKNAKAKRPEGK